MDECSDKAFSFFPPTVQRVPDEKLMSFCEQPICMSVFESVMKYQIVACSLNGIRVHEYIYYHKERCDMLNSRANDEPEHLAC